MAVEEVLNCCDAPREYTDRMHIFGYDTYSRVYIGSYFCCNRFINTDSTDIDRFDDKDITIVIPMLMESKIDACLKNLETLYESCSKRNPEIVVNEIGTLKYVSENYDCPITAGRLFFKDLRDFRYNGFRDKNSPNILSTAFARTLNDFKVSSVELDRCWNTIDFSDRIDDFNIHLHQPYAYLSVGNLCEYASVDEKDNYKFRASMDCNQECDLYHTAYLVGGVPHYRFGKAVLTHAIKSKLTALDNYRDIFYPFSLGGN